MTKPTIILATSNGVGMGHLARASALAISLKEIANPIIVSMAGGIAEIPGFMDIRCEYIPGKDRMWMSREKWDIYLRDRLLALVQETNAKVLTFDGVVPYPGVIAAKNSNPDLKLVWVRRGLWQKKPQRFVLGLQSAMMDKIIEPGDIARAYDFGPTAIRDDAVLTSPVSLFRKEDAMTRDDARRALGLDLNRPTVLVQLGTGDSDVNEKMTAALSGLLGWKDLQVILTKAPIDKDGKSLAPEGLDLKVVRYFPLAKVLHAFDAGICATGYNGVHELLPAQIPTVFVSNIRGTDDQEARAKWCNDFGFALRADQADHDDITAKVRMLQDP
jgi:UDP-N-acetylglucosamine:LPS N-acetylglucosamine transferase